MTPDERQHHQAPSRLAAIHFEHANALIGAGAQPDSPALGQAIDAYRRALELMPDYFHALVNLSAVLLQLNRNEEALPHLRRATELDQTGSLFNDLGNCLRRLARLDEAKAAYERAAEANPAAPDAYNNLGTLLADQNRFAEAIEFYQSALQRNPNSAVAHTNLANAFRELGRLNDAGRSARRAIEIQPDLAEAHNNLASVLRDQARIDEAIAGYRRAVALRPNYSEAHSSLLYTLYFSPTVSPKHILSEHRAYAAQHAAGLAAQILPRAVDRSADRPLRIGYVSPDFCNHALARFFLPLLKHHDRHDFDIFCYSDVAAPDEMTARLRAVAAAPDHWHHTAGLSHTDLANLIRSHRIDIVVDLALHSANNRMLTFARQPAPLQVTYLGYPGTTGLPTMHYRLTDRFLDPPSSQQTFCTERSLYLNSYWCYSPPESAPAVDELPALRNNAITFISLNNFTKCSPAALQTWSTLLARIPGSRLILYCLEGAHRDRLRKLFDNRVEFVSRLSFTDYLATYSRADIALDPFPYCGGATTFDAVFMGLPVITLAGDIAPHRAGASILSQLELPHLVARSIDAYIQTALDLAADLDGLSTLRRSLRQKMLDSPLCDGPAFARDLERAYREIWRTHCRLGA